MSESVIRIEGLDKEQLCATIKGLVKAMALSLVPLRIEIKAAKPDTLLYFLKCSNLEKISFRELTF